MARQRVQGRCSVHETVRVFGVCGRRITDERLVAYLMVVWPLPPSLSVYPQSRYSQSPSLLRYLRFLLWQCSQARRTRRSIFRLFTTTGFPSGPTTPAAPPPAPPAAAAAGKATVEAAPSPSSSSTTRTGADKAEEGWALGPEDGGGGGAAADDALGARAAAEAVFPVAEPADRGRAPVHARGGKGAMGRSVMGSVRPVGGGMPGTAGTEAAAAMRALGAFVLAAVAGPESACCCWTRRASVAWGYMRMCVYMDGSASVLVRMCARWFLRTTQGRTTLPILTMSLTYLPEEVRLQVGEGDVLEGDRDEVHPRRQAVALKALLWGRVGMVSWESVMGRDGKGAP